MMMPMTGQIVFSSVILVIIFSLVANVAPRGKSLLIESEMDSPRECPP